MGRFAYMSEMENKNWIYDLIFKNEQKYLNTTKLKSWSLLWFMITNKQK